MNGLECELKNLTTLKLFRLPISYEGKFLEVDDTRSYTLRELCDMAPVERTLRLVNAQEISISGIPNNYCGFITMADPLAAPFLTTA